MNNYLLLVMLILASSALPGHAAKDKPKAQAVASLSEQLKPLVLKMDQALGLSFDQKGPGVEARATVLRGEFAGQRAAAPEAERSRFDAAITVCDEIVKAMTSKRTMHERMKNSGVFHGKGKTGSGKKGPEGNEKFFADQIKGDWREEKSKLMMRINAAYSKLTAAEAK
jgi:hypothetical protein